MATASKEDLLHYAAYHGDKKKIKKLLERGYDVDLLNDDCKTPLYIACETAHEGAAELLLKYGANPNRRNQMGTTPLHMAAKCCSKLLITSMITAGGDLRLHDEKGQSIEDYVQKGTDDKKRRSMVAHLRKIELLARSHRVAVKSGAYNSFLTFQSWFKDRCSTRSLFKRLNGFNLLQGVPAILKFGYEAMFVGLEGTCGAVGVVPHVNEQSVQHDEYGDTYNNGPFMVMESMIWINTVITVKRLHKELQKEGYIDLIIKEKNFMLQTSHPNILQFMGIGVTDNLGDLFLVYERITCGSLNYFLYNKKEMLDLWSMCEIMIQVCTAIQYLHDRDLLHCGITSHAIQLVDQKYAKIGNFEFMMSRTDVERHKRHSEKRWNYREAVLNWMAPEIMAELPPVAKSDLYSLAACLWEMTHGEEPWAGFEASDIELELLRNGHRLQVDRRIPTLLYSLLSDGLELEPCKRKSDVLHFCNILRRYQTESSQIEDENEFQQFSKKPNLPPTSRGKWKCPSPESEDQDVDFNGQESDQSSKTSPLSSKGKPQTTVVNADDTHSEGTITLIPNQEDSLNTLVELQNKESTAESLGAEYSTRDIESVVGRALSPDTEVSQQSSQTSVTSQAASENTYQELFKESTYEEIVEVLDNALEAVQEIRTSAGTRKERRRRQLLEQERAAKEQESAACADAEEVEQLNGELDAVPSVSNSRSATSGEYIDDPDAVPSVSNSRSATSGENVDNPDAVPSVSNSCSANTGEYIDELDAVPSKSNSGSVNTGENADELDAVPSKSNPCNATPGEYILEPSHSYSNCSSKSKFSFKRMFHGNSRRRSDQDLAELETNVAPVENVKGSVKKWRKKKSSEMKKRKECNLPKESSDDQSQGEYQFLQDSTKRPTYQDIGKWKRATRKKVDRGSESKEMSGALGKQTSGEQLVEDQYKKKEKTDLSCLINMSGVNQLETDSSQVPSDQGEPSKRSNFNENQHNKNIENGDVDGNPFKKFMSAEYSDIISDEIKAILAKPMKMPKLPSQYRIFVPPLSARKSVEKKSPSMAESLARLYVSPSNAVPPTSSGNVATSEAEKAKMMPSVSYKEVGYKEMSSNFPENPYPAQSTESTATQQTFLKNKKVESVISPVKAVTQETFLKSKKAESVISPVKAVSPEIVTVSATATATPRRGFRCSSPQKAVINIHNKSCSSLGSSCHDSSFDSVVKPASHHIPQKSPRVTDQIEHYAFPKGGRQPTHPGNVSTSFHAANSTDSTNDVTSVRLNERKQSSHTFGQDNSGVIPPLQSCQVSSVTSNRSSSDGKSYKEASDEKPRSLSFSESKVYSNNITTRFRKPEGGLTPRDKFFGIRKDIRSETQVPPTGSETQMPPTASEIQMPPTGSEIQMPPTGSEIQMPPTALNTMPIQTSEMNRQQSQMHFTKPQSSLTQNASSTTNQQTFVNSQSSAPIAGSGGLMQTLLGEKVTKQPAKAPKSKLFNQFNSHKEGIKVRNITDAFQEKLEKHIEHQASLVCKKPDPSTPPATTKSPHSDTFFTPPAFRLRPTLLTGGGHTYWPKDNVRPKTYHGTAMPFKPTYNNQMGMSYNRRTSPQGCSYYSNVGIGGKFCTREKKTAQQPLSSTDEDICNYVDEEIRIARREVIEDLHRSPSWNKTNAASVQAFPGVTRQMRTVYKNSGLIDNRQADVSASNGSCDSATVANERRRSRNSDGSSVERRTDDIEDLYFDDSLTSDLGKEDHMCLQNHSASNQMSDFDYNDAPLYSCSGTSTEKSFEYVPVYDVETVQYPGHHITRSSFKKFRKITTVTRDESHNTTEDSEDSIQV